MKKLLILPVLAAVLVAPNLIRQSNADVAFVSDYCHKAPNSPLCTGGFPNDPNDDEPSTLASMFDCGLATWEELSKQGVNCMAQQDYV